MLLWRCRVVPGGLGHGGRRSTSSCVGASQQSAELLLLVREAFDEFVKFGRDLELAADFVFGQDEIGRDGFGGAQGWVLLEIGVQGDAGALLPLTFEVDLDEFDECRETDTLGQFIEAVGMGGEGLVVPRLIEGDEPCFEAFAIGGGEG